MSNLLSDASRWLRGMTRANLSVPVEYISRDGERKSMAAVLGRTLFRAENGYGVTVRTESRDFLVSVADLPETPERGEKIVYDGRVYEILAPDGEPCWRWSGNFHDTRRIHTKETGEYERRDT